MTAGAGSPSRGQPDRQEPGSHEPGSNEPGSHEPGRQELIVDRRGPVATITLNRPERRNALSWALVGEIRAALAVLRDDDRVRVVVITGSGTKAFCAGADLEGMGGSDPEGAADRHQRRGEIAGLFEDLWALGKPTIAKVRGYALAGGMGLALACDLVVASDDAIFGTPEIDVGLWPFMIGVPLSRSMPPKKALELMMTGRRVDAREADRLGFVTRVVPADGLDDEVDDLAATLAAKPPGAMQVGRDAFYGTWDLPADEALSLLHGLLSETAESEEAAEGIAAFLDKRAPAWRQA